ncbi:MAG TPA: hypothetical protein VI452_12455 [Marmoricola sp.]
MALLLTAGVLVVVRITPGSEIRLGRAAAGVLAELVVTGLAVRSGGRPLLPGLLTAAGAGAAVATGQPLLLGASAVVTAVAGAVLAVVATTPAATFLRTVREVLLALGIAALAALAVAGFAVPLGVVRLGYVVLGLALLGSLALVYSLGAGLHGLGRRGKVLVVAALLLLVVALAYTQALAHWGSPGLVHAVDRLRNGTRATLHAVPHPIEVLVGIPALAWGVFMRARRRQGWWVTAFGAAFTAPVATRLVDPGVALSTTLLSEGYSLLGGLLVGYLVVRAEQVLAGSHGRRARRHEEAGAHRPEPGRTAALQ